jgi:release factor glutamine methyltransferase
MRVIELIQQATSELIAAGVEEAGTDVHLLLGHCLGKSRTELFLAADAIVSEYDLRLFRDLLQRRKNREPLAYILGEREFWSLPFIVNPAVLIPGRKRNFSSSRPWPQPEDKTPVAGSLICAAAAG